MAIALASTVTVGSGGAFSIDFTNIPQTGKDLIVLVSARTQYQFGDNIRLSLNGSTTNFSARDLWGTGSTAFSSTDSPSPNGLAYVPDSDETANTFGNASVYISNYTSSSSKSFSVEGVAENNATNARQRLGAGLWSNSAAITSLSILMENGPIEQYTTASLYIVDVSSATANGGTSSPKATGGTITLSGGYFYHTFTSSGTFTPSQNITCDYVVVAGGGGGGGNNSAQLRAGGGGGAGGYIAQASQSLTSGTNYTITIGAGGSGTIVPTNGSNTTAFSQTADGGGAGGYRNSTTEVAGANGGSGGGGLGHSSGAATAGGTGVSGEGFAGGTGQVVSVESVGGGGGGANAAGVTPSTGNGPNGGAGKQWLNGTTYAGGGGGGNDYPTGPATIAGSGGTGGGGRGAVNSTNTLEGIQARDAIAGETSTGGGGGGGVKNRNSGNGANGGSGIVIVRYAA